MDMADFPQQLHFKDLLRVLLYIRPVEMRFTQNLTLHVLHQSCGQSAFGLTAACAVHSSDQVIGEGAHQVEPGATRKQAV